MIYALPFIAGAITGYLANRAGWGILWSAVGGGFAGGLVAVSLSLSGAVQ